LIRQRGIRRKPSYPWLLPLLQGSIAMWSQSPKAAEGTW
jgi:hypothetical protein